jgi:hypothetical protein
MPRRSVFCGAQRGVFVQIRGEIVVICVTVGDALFLVHILVQG